MAPRFNKEPINLIHRIPSQKQIDEARPVPAPYGQLLLDAGAACWRKMVDLFAYVTRYEDETSPRIRKPLALPDRTMEHTTIQQDHLRPNVGGGAGPGSRESTGFKGHDSTKASPRTDSC